MNGHEVLLDFGSSVILKMNEIYLGIYVFQVSNMMKRKKQKLPGISSKKSSPKLRKQKRKQQKSVCANN